MLADEMAGHLNAYGIGVYDADSAITTTVDDFAIYVDFMPDNPDRAICIRQTGGGKRDMRLVGYDYPTAEVLVRGDGDPRTAEAAAIAVYDSLHGITAATFNGGTTYIHKCQATNGPNSLGPDKNGRAHFSINFELIARRV
jgi:hypothetical protein